jgi:hypothetical protein
VCAAIRGGQLVAIGAGRATHDAVLMVPGICRGFLLGPVVGHRIFDREHTSVMVSDNEEERLGRIQVRHPFLLPRISCMINDVELNRFAVVL